MNYIMDVDTNNQTDLWNGQIILVGEDLQFREYILALISKIGGRITDPLTLDAEDSEIESRLNAVAVIFHAGHWDSKTRHSLLRTHKFCHNRDLPLLVLLPLDLLDNALGFLDSPNVEYLITDEQGPLAAELVVTLNSQIKKTRSSTFEHSKETDLVDLKKISDDVDRIARVLSQLSDENTDVLTRKANPNPLIEPDSNATVSEAPFRFKGEDRSKLAPFGTAPAIRKETGGSITSYQIRKLLKARRLRDQYFDTELFADPAWDMLLDLMAARLEGTEVSVSSLCIAASVPPTTALRWINTMTEEGVFDRKADEKDGRRIFIELSDQAAAGMVGFFATIRRHNLMMV